MVYKLIIESLSIFMLMSKWIVAIIIIYPFYSYFFAILLLGSAEGHEYPDLQVRDEVNPRWLFCFRLSG